MQLAAENDTISVLNSPLKSVPTIVFNKVGLYYIFNYLNNIILLHCRNRKGSQTFTDMSWDKYFNNENSHQILRNGHRFGGHS